MTVQVYFIGAGPGDPDLLTLKAKRIIEQADVIIYADSLVNPDICGLAKKGAEIHGSASLPLGSILKIMMDSAGQGKLVARLHSGDPSLYGAIQEQMSALEREGIPYEVIPGVSSLFAAAACLKSELTVPELSQTVIITRIEGRTPVPASESLRELARHQATMAVFLSAAAIDQVVAELLEGGYPPETPAAVVYRASWKEEKTLRASLGDIAGQVKASGIEKQAIILVGRFLAERGKAPQSRLYSKGFSHGRR